MSDPSASLAAALSALPGTQGRVTSARVKDGVVTVILEVGGLSAEKRAALEQQVREAASEAAGVSEVRVAMTQDRIGRTIVAVGSGKGGVGKSTVAANLAVALARSGLEVGLVDADIYGPSQPRIMGSSERPDMIDKQIVPVEAWGVRMLSIGQLVEAGSALAWRGPMAASALGQLVEGDWGDTEVMVVDLPPGTGDVQLSLIQKWKPAGAVIVSTPQDLALIDATRAIDLFRKMDVPILGLVENMSGYVCPSCGETSDPFGSGGAEAAAGVMSIPFLGKIPLTLSIRQASDEGRPPAAGDGAEAEAFAGIASRLAEALNLSRA
ncbi:MAG TPA: P-loop NTPase [Allosphingosinicella sp.]|jgi:ATP-binding protein involved in chromosome partitioning